MSGTPLICNLEYHERKEPRPFCVVIHDCALEHLMSDARQALRVYELMSITRPGDVCKYLWVELLEVSGEVQGRAAEQRKEIIHPPEKVWPESFVPLVEFDRYFFWAWDDTDPEDACWLSHRESRLFLRTLRTWFEKVVETQQVLRLSADPLIRFEVGSMATCTHPYDVDPDPPFQRTRPDYQSPAIPKRSAEYYAKFREMLLRQDLESLTVSGAGLDFQTFRMACTMQRERAEASGKHPFEAFPISVTCDCEEWDRGWGTYLFEYEEGVGYGDMWLLNGDESGDHMRRLVEERKDYQKWFFFHHGAVAIPGYRMLQGEGWMLLEDETEERDYRKGGKASLEARFQRARARDLKMESEEPHPA